MPAEPIRETTPADTVLKRWIIVHEPGKVPEKKIPHPQTCDGEADFLIALALCRPEGTRYIVARLTWDHDLWVSEGGEDLAMLRAERPRIYAKRVRSIAEQSAGWLKAGPKRIAAVARGHLP